MSKRNNFTGVNNRVNARGVAFIKSRKSIDNVKTILNDMNSMAGANGITLTRAYHDPSFSLDFDRRELDDFFEMIDSECAQVVVVRSLNEITDNVSDLEKFILTLAAKEVAVYCIAIGPVPVTISHAEDYGC